MKIAVIGGTGLIGSKLVHRLRKRGHEVDAASPASGVNTITGQGLADVFDGMEVVVDASNSPSLDDAAALGYFETSTRNILAAEAAAGVGHHVALSVVGSRRLADIGYFRAKLVQETLILGSSIPFAILRATQCFEFITRIADAATNGNEVRLAPVLIQPIAADDVARELASIAAGSASNRVVEVAGPQTFTLDEIVARVLRKRGDPRDVISDRRALYFGARVNLRSLVPGDEVRLATTRIDDWLSLASSGYRPEAGPLLAC